MSEAVPARGDEPSASSASGAGDADERPRPLRARRARGLPACPRRACGRDLRAQTRRPTARRRSTTARVLRVGSRPRRSARPEEQRERRPTSRRHGHADERCEQLARHARTWMRHGSRVSVAGSGNRSTSAAAAIVAVEHGEYDSCRGAGARCTSTPASSGPAALPPDCASPAKSERGGGRPPGRARRAPRSQRR